VPNEGVADEHASELVSLDWEGRVEGQVQQRRVFSEEAFDKDPTLSASRMARWPELASEQKEKGLTVYRDKTKGGVVGAEQSWTSGLEELVVIYDAESQVVERAHFVYRTRLRWVDGAMDFFEDVWDRIWP
jgi:hypothetical protein